MSVCRYCQVVEQTEPSKVCALITTKWHSGVHRLDNIMTVQLYNWSKQSVWSTSLNISTNGLSKVCALVTTKSKVYTDPIRVENGLWPLRCPQNNLEFFSYIRPCEKFQEGFWNFARLNIQNLKLSRVAWKNDAVVLVFHFNITYYSQCLPPLDTVPQPDFLLPHLPIHTGCLKKTPHFGFQVLHGFTYTFHKMLEQYCYCHGLQLLKMLSP
jgi:hypothetical protein